MAKEIQLETVLSEEELKAFAEIAKSLEDFKRYAKKLDRRFQDQENSMDAVALGV